MGKPCRSQEKERDNYGSLAQGANCSRKRKVVLFIIPNSKNSVLFPFYRLVGTAI